MGFMRPAPGDRFVLHTTAGRLSRAVVEVVKVPPHLPGTAHGGVDGFWTLWGDGRVPIRAASAYNYFPRMPASSQPDDFSQWRGYRREHRQYPYLVLRAVDLLREAPLEEGLLPWPED